MTHDRDISLNLSLHDAEPLPIAVLPFSAQQIHQAMQLTDSISAPVEQWQAYLQILAKLGLQQWLQERAPELSVRSLSNDQIQVGAFKLHVVAIGSFTDEWIAVPKMAIEYPNPPHLYGLVEVLEEQEQVRILGCLRQDEIRQQCRLSALRSEENHYLLPLQWFNLNPDHLLLYLRHLHPAAIAAPAVNNSVNDSVNHRWINVGFWFRDQLDAIANELAWVLLPPPTYASAMRSVQDLQSPTEQFDRMMRALIAQGTEVSSQARAAFRDFLLGGSTLRLYIVTWELQRVPTEWTLLAILGTPSGEPLPPVKIRVRDGSQILDEQALSASQSATMLYIQVFGELNEPFQVAIETANGEILTLPPFTLNPTDGD